MKNNEPLKGKVWTLIDMPWDEDIEGDRCFTFEDVKSAVQGLINDVRARMHKNCDCDVCMKLSWVVDDIKKWFADIFENEK